ncbi:hypothetical protein [Streptomyces sp. TRM68416]|uniref:hypothetical protein n=1 Tax=Streptomyces sp. TRM68416 TaxID=2758412 RepID=UPI001661D0B5|nr:hypothetical protein [Streptomyces sp. TRM68416]MBD0838808.1 hypothetical protein [Streptomyces sp. TRM68416]
MTKKPTASTEARDLRALLEAVRDALTLDYGVPDHDERLKERAGLAQVVLRDGLDVPDRIGWNADWLRHKLTAEETEAAERAKNRCRRCHRPFDPADTRHDGQARHRETPWCRWCVDRCHESTDFAHACPVCDPPRGGEAK